MNSFHKKIEHTNGFRAMRTLQTVAEDPRVALIEGRGMDKGRVFVHLKRGFCYDRDRGCPAFNQTFRSAGSARELRILLSDIVIETSG